MLREAIEVRSGHESDIRIGLVQTFGVRREDLWMKPPEIPSAMRSAIVSATISIVSRNNADRRRVLFAVTAKKNRTRSVGSLPSLQVSSSNDILKFTFSYAGSRALDLPRQ
jgi:hypothetical protein